ncbi:hypothetical protein NP83_02480, partial [Neobacillus niacini]
NYHAHYFLGLCEKLLDSNKLNKLKQDYSEETATKIHCQIIIEAEQQFSKTLEKIKKYIDVFSTTNYRLDGQEGFDFLEEAANVISNIRYLHRVYDIEGGMKSFRVKILEEFETLENYLYYMLMQFIENNDQLIRCTICNEYIVEPTARELANYKISGVITHAKVCRDIKNLKKDNERNKVNYWKKKVSK